MIKTYCIMMGTLIFIWALISIFINIQEKNDGAFIEIRTCEDLSNIRNNLEGNYILMNDIDCGGGL